MASTPEQSGDAAPTRRGTIGHWIAVGLLFGVLCGVFFGEYCSGLEQIGRAYVGLLQMTVLPYLVLSLVSKIARLDARQARRLGVAAFVVLMVIWLIAIVLIVLVSSILPPIEGASFFSPDQGEQQSPPDILTTFIPTNFFRSLSREYVPAVVVFCLFLGFGLMMVQGKERLLDLMDLVSDGVGRINSFLVRLAPIGLFTLTAAAAGTLRLEEISRLQAYLIILSVASAVAAFLALPLLLTSLSDLAYRDILRAAEAPMLTAVATGKLFVVLPQIADNCEALLRTKHRPASQLGAKASVLVPLAYPFPHIGKILACVFISFGAWYVGRGLTTEQTVEMAAQGAFTSFASPLVTIPYLLQQYRLPQDLMGLFIVPGFITTRIGDVVGVMHLMVLTLLVTLYLEGQLRVRWGKLCVSTVIVLLCLGVAGAISRTYISTTTLKYDLDDRFMALEVPVKYDDVVVYRVGEEIPDRPSVSGSTLERVKSHGTLRVGYHPEHLPYTFFNSGGRLVGMDVDLMYRLAQRLEVRLEFVPFNYESVEGRLTRGEIDVAVGGLTVNPERLLVAGFTTPYQSGTVAMVVPDYRSAEFATWDSVAETEGLRIATVQEEISRAAGQRFPNVEVVVIDSVAQYFQGNHKDLDGLVVNAEEAAAWNVLYPENAVVVPEPPIQRPVAMAVRPNDADWLNFLDRWLDFERFDGTLDRLRVYWVEGGGTADNTKRWCVIRDVLHWVE